MGGNIFYCTICEFDMNIKENTELFQGNFIEPWHKHTKPNSRWNACTWSIDNANVGHNNHIPMKQFQVLKDDEQRADYDYMLDNPGETFIPLI